MFENFGFRGRKQFQISSDFEVSVRKRFRNLPWLPLNIRVRVRAPLIFLKSNIIAGNAVVTRERPAISQRISTLNGVHA